MFTQRERAALERAGERVELWRFGAILDRRPFAWHSTCGLNGLGEPVARCGMMPRGGLYFEAVLSLSDIRLGFVTVCDACARALDVIR